jgi:hypothetical protein
MPGSGRNFTSERFRVFFFFFFFLNKSYNFLISRNDVHLSHSFSSRFRMSYKWIWESQVRSGTFCENSEFPKSDCSKMQLLIFLGTNRRASLINELKNSSPLILLQMTRLERFETSPAERIEYTRARGEHSRRFSSLLFPEVDCPIVFQSVLTPLLVIPLSLRGLKFWSACLRAGPITNDSYGPYCWDCCLGPYCDRYSSTAIGNETPSRAGKLPNQQRGLLVGTSFLLLIHRALSPWPSSIRVHKKVKDK